MLNNTTAAPENRRPWSWYRVGAPEEHLLRSVLPRSGTRFGAPEEPGSVLLRSWLLRSRVGNSQERPSSTYPHRDPPPPPGMSRHFGPNFQNQSKPAAQRPHTPPPPSPRVG